MSDLLKESIRLKKIDHFDMIWDIASSSNNIEYLWLGKQDYNSTWELQKAIHKKRVTGKISDIVLFVEHDHVYTFGKNADKNYLLDSKSKSTNVVQIDRGGEVTYHGPGQLVCYPIIDLHKYKMSISWYMRSLENIIINLLYQYGIESKQKPGLTGVWVDDDKICAMGVRLSRWVTMHGLALNLDPDMTYYDGIIPCGIFEYGVTSLKELGVTVDIFKIAEKMIEYINDELISI